MPSKQQPSRKKCTKCGRTRATSKFRQLSTGYRQGMCVDCEREYERARWHQRSLAAMPQGEFLTVAQLVVRYGGAWAPAVIRRHARAGMLPHVKFPGRKDVLFPLADLERFEAGEVNLEMVILPNGGRICRPRS